MCEYFGYAARDGEVIKNLNFKLSFLNSRLGGDTLRLASHNSNRIARRKAISEAGKKVNGDEEYQETATIYIKKTNRPAIVIAEQLEKRGFSFRVRSHPQFSPFHPLLIQLKFPA